MKRIFDTATSTLGLLVLSPLFVTVALLIKLTSPGPILFRQQRIGLAGRPFLLLKFRSMVQDAPQQGGQVTFGKDPRITRIGHFLRMTKIDELPQLINVLKGDMSLVGPRPEVLKYVEMFQADYEEILRVRPGITDLASIEYRDEAMVLGEAEDPEKEYIQRVLPEKIRLSKEYLTKASFFYDLTIILKTLMRLFSDRLVSADKREKSNATRS